MLQHVVDKIFGFIFILFISIHIYSILVYIYFYFVSGAHKNLKTRKKPWLVVIPVISSNVDLIAGDQVDSA